MNSLIGRETKCVICATSNSEIEEWNKRYPCPELQVPLRDFKICSGCGKPVCRWCRQSNPHAILCRNCYAQNPIRFRKIALALEEADAELRFIQSTGREFKAVRDEPMERKRFVRDCRRALQALNGTKLRRQR